MPAEIYTNSKLLFHYLEHSQNLYDSSAICTSKGFPEELNSMEEHKKIIVGPDATLPGLFLDYPSLCRNPLAAPQKT